MSDEQEPRRDPPGRQPDETRAAGNQPDDGPRPDDAWVTDGTQPMPRTPPAGDDDATVLTPRQDETSVMPPVRDWAAQDAAWAGRAEVRPPRPGQADYGTGSDWDAVPPGEPRGKWWMPILVGTLALILLGFLGWGVYLITQNSDDGDENPAPAASVPAPAVTTVPTSTAPTTTPPTTTPPTTEETTNPPDVVVPALVGLSQRDAEEALRLRGLKFRSITQPSDSPVGTVIDSDPSEGQEVPADTRVTLVIAAARTAPTTSPATSPPAGQPDED